MIVEHNKPDFIGKQVAERYFNSGKGLLEWNSTVYKISDVRYNYEKNGSTSYDLVLLNENNNESHSYPISEGNLMSGALPNTLMLAESSEYKKTLEDKRKYIEQEKKENERQEKEKAQRKQNIAQFEKACPECANIYLVHNDVKCPLSMSLAISQCRNIKYKKDSSRRISVYLEGCPGGDGSVVFSYGTQFAQVESLSINGRYLSRNIFTAEELDSTVFSWCWIALTTNNK